MNDKGSFDGGSHPFMWGVRGLMARLNPAKGITFRAALPERRINVDRVSIRKGAAIAGRLWNPQRSGTSAYVGRDYRSTVDDASHDGTPFTNADSYSRCFRYLDCFGGVPVRYGYGFNG